MNNLQKLLPGLMLLALPFSSQATKTILCGKFKYKPEKTVTVLYYLSSIDMIENAHSKVETDVDADGKFKLEINIDRPSCINVMNGSNWLFYNKYINPGDSLHFDFDSTDINIAGRGESGIGSMFVYESMFENQEHRSQNDNSFRNLADVEFAKYWDKQIDSGLTFYNSYYAKNPTPNEFASVVTAELKYDALKHLMRFGWRGAHGNLDIFNKPEYMQYITKHALNDSDALASDRYVSFLGDFTKYLLEPTAGRTGKQIPYFDRIPLRDSIAKRYLTGKVYDIELYDILYGAIRYTNNTKGSAKFDTVYAKTASAINILGKGFHDKSLWTRLQEKLKASKEDGKPAPDFSGTTPDGKKVRLSDFKGKIVYVDFWSTNCVPCVQELPHIKRLQQKYKGENVVFLYFSFDNSVDVLKRFIKEKDFTGVHINDPKGFASDAALKYHISGMPRHIIVDKNGILVNFDAPRPSAQPEQILDKLLGKNVEE